VSACRHPQTDRIIDRLGMMRERNGVLGAPVLEAHVACLDCGATLSREVKANPDDPVENALAKMGDAIAAIRAFRASRQGGS
jgi:hypothetical protein